MSQDKRDRLHELLADRALVGLDRKEERELIELFALFPELDVEEYDRVAAACALAAIQNQVEQMPMGLADKLLAQHSGETPASVKTTMGIPQGPAHTIVMPDRPVRPADVIPLQPKTTKRASNVFALTGWLAAAAILVLSIGAFTWKMRAPKTIGLDAQYAALVGNPGTTKASFAGTEDPSGKGATGEVIWNATEQKGFMRFKGLAKNDPKAVQYQLWIFDKDRDDKYPVDGGVFDVSGEDVIVPIKAQLAVSKPVLWAVTAEKPGGVVVSKRERIVIAAKPAT